MRSSDWSSDVCSSDLEDAMQPGIKTFCDEATFTATHVVWDPGTRRAAIIDSVKDYDPKSGRIATASADAVVAFVAAETLAVEWTIGRAAYREGGCQYV